ncbi:MAG: DNA polymerase III subunit beta [Chloroflexia bacterium]
MKIVCSQDQFNRGLNIVGKAVSTRSTLPVLNNILLATDNGRLKLTATNLEIGVTYWLPCKSVETEGAITVPARLLQEFVSSLPNDLITLDVNEGSYNVHLTCARYEANIRGIDAEEFPTMQKPAGAPLVSLPAALLRDMINQVSFAASRDDNRPVLAGVLISFNGPKAIMAAADGFRLAVRTAELEQPAGSEQEVRLIVPARALEELARALPEAGTGDDTQVSITLTPNRNQVLFQADNLNVTSRLVDGNFPNYEQIIPSDWTTRTVATTTDLQKAMKIASFFARDNASVVKLTTTPAGELEPGLLTITANAAEVGDNQSQLDVLIDGDGNQIAFNARYVMDVLGVINTAQVALETQAPGSPGVFKPVGSDSYLHVIMPMHLAAR